MLARTATAKSWVSGLEPTRTSFAPFLFQTRTILRDFTISHRHQRGEDWKEGGIRKSPKQLGRSHERGEGGDGKPRAARGDRRSDKPTASNRYPRYDDRKSESYKPRYKQSDESKVRGDARERRTRGSREDSGSATPYAAERRSPREELVPFEGKVPMTSLSERVEGSTMTPKELRVFEQLFKVKPSKLSGRWKGKEIDERDTGSDPGKAQQQTVDGRPARGEAKNNRKVETKSKGIVEAPKARPETTGVARPQIKREFPDLLRPLAEEAAAFRALSAVDEGKKTSEDRSISTSTQDEAAAKKLESIKSSMDGAKTDVALGNVLQDQIFTYVKTLSDSDRPVKAGRDFQVLTQTLPQSLLYYMKSLRDSFPGSLLGLVLLPTLKKLGPSAFALGATTELFNEHMWLLYKHYADLDGIAETLSEMDKNVYEFDSGTRDLIATVLRDGRKSLNNSYGPGMKALWSTDRKTRGLEKIRHWEGVVEERLKAAALRAAMEEQASVAEDDEEEEQNVAVA
ncbi:hypothetical protein PRZ48_011098 [Zasmidium cellare]|uniref:Mtf2-like C-terminal domain-containing protein n=1 Tax=Zasmidium cellare TaxID=395010 RepID=A0ABR0EAH1_ZASCE|nr:hypothetical protein PRZ48_011098 [Zasmidium cellare]